MDETVERLYDRLTEAVQRVRGDFDTPVTVAEIYQELVPYRLVRGDVGFDMNADYEHALLRLLSGEGERARLEPAHAREEILRELKSANPNVSIYRGFAGCDVWIAAPEPRPDRAATAEARGPGRADDAAAAVRRRAEDAVAAVDDVLADDDDDAGVTDWRPLQLMTSDAAADADNVLPFALVDGDSTGAETAPADATAHPAAAAAGAPAESPGAGESSGRESSGAAAATRTRCEFCDSALPAHRPVRFCPYCGHDLSTRPCASCGEALEPGWTFCVSCGATAER
ncbi:MAG TPA: zinc ribbon domain-containing protein [Longimicrobiales bacterium]|nr:zinc ribbon domain-containing protein [Longimicrobiales bacterium]